MKKYLIIAGIVLAALAAVAFVAVRMQLSGALSGVAQPVRPGDRMPPFSLTDHLGNTHTLEQYAGKIVVLDFSSHKCPFSLGVDPHFAALARQYADNAALVFLGIDSHYDTSIQEIRDYAEASQLPFPILKDVDNLYADAAGALVTPDFFVIDQEGRLAYRGSFDNRIRPDSAGSRGYVAEAVAALLAGKRPDPAHVRAWGCTIKRK